MRQRQPIAGLAIVGLARLSIVVFSCIALLCTVPTLGRPAAAAAFSSLAVLQSQPEPGFANNDVALQFTGHSAASLRCITVAFSTNPDPGGTHTAPLGFSALNAAFSGAFYTSWTGWTANNTTAMARVTRPSGSTPDMTQPAQLQLSNIRNGSTPDAMHFVHLRTFSDTGCTSLVDSGTASIQWNTSTTVSAQVERSMSLQLQGLNGGSCNAAPITGTGSTASAISLGRVEPQTTAVGGQSISVYTNATNGFLVNARLNSPLNDGNGHNIADIAASANAPAPFPSPGTEAFGFTTNASNLSGVPNRFTNGGPYWAALPSYDTEVMNANTTGSYVNCLAFALTIGKQTVGGRYGTSITYSLVPRF